MKDQITHLPDNADRSVAKQKFKISNWPTYNKALINRGSITFWGSRDFPSKNDKVLWRPRRPWPPEGYYFSLTGKYPSIERISS
ncbi:hypothetical protein MN549_28075, partial [Klebsiella pneumoniae]|nr:hypothetical protein [Klebsiella pneumoniae]